MPVSGDSSAAVQESAGSSALASAALSMVRPSTSLIFPCAPICSSLAVSASLVATISLPTFLCATPCESQKV